MVPNTLPPEITGESAGRARTRGRLMPYGGRGAQVCARVRQASIEARSRWIAMRRCASGITGL